MHDTRSRGGACRHTGNMRANGADATGGEHLAVKGGEDLLAARLNGGQQRRAKLGDLVLDGADAGVERGGHQCARVAVHGGHKVVGLRPVVLAVRAHKVQPLQAAARTPALHGGTAENWVHCLHKQAWPQAHGGHAVGLQCAIGITH